jgi:hypothetical protein
MGISREQIWIVPTVQPTECDILQINPASDAEKDRLLENFISWAKRIRDNISAEYWVDAIDPCSGYPYFGQRGSSIYGEVEGFQLVLKYSCDQVGNCRVLRHPVWGTSIYPATLFTNAPKDVLERAIQISK